MKTQSQDDVPLADKLALVTGAYGFVGSHMLDLLMEKGIGVRATDLEGADRSHVNRLGVSARDDVRPIKGLKEYLEEGLATTESSSPFLLKKTGFLLYFFRLMCK